MAKKRRPALSAAAARGNAGTVQRLLAAGADVNAVDDTGQTALMKAVQSGNEETARVLLEAGADVNIVDSKEGFTALFHATVGGDPLLVDLLIDPGVDMKQKDRYGNTALSRAADYRKNLNVVQALARGGSRNEPVARGNPTLSWHLRSVGAPRMDRLEVDVFRLLEQYCYAV